MTRILVAGVGNIFLSDDGFGVEAATRLARESLPAGVEVADFGIRGMHLAYQLLEGYDALVLIDAMARDKTPGTVTVIEPELGSALDGSVLDAHGMAPDEVVALIGSLARQTGSAAPDRIFVVGCEPVTCEEGIGLSPAVDAAIGPALDVVRQLVNQVIEKGGGDGGQTDSRDRAARGGGGGGGVASGHRAVLEDPGNVRT